MQYILTGFTQESGHRIFTFEHVGENRARTQFTVSADLSLSQRYGIAIQELPLLCRGFLERSHGGEMPLGNLRKLVYAEADMRLFATDRASAKEAAAQKRKPPRRPTNTENMGNGWRVPHP